MDIHGELVAKVGYYLLRKGTVPLKMIADETSLDVKKVQRTLCTLIQHGMVEFEKNPRGFLQYSMNISKVVSCLRYPRYVHCAKLLYGDVAEILVEELLQVGQTSMNNLINKATDRVNADLETEGRSKIAPSVVQDKFTNLVRTHFLQRCFEPKLDDAQKVISLEPPPDPKELFVIPPMEIEGGGKGVKRKRSDEAESSSKKLKTDSGEGASGGGVYWRVNCQRFHRHLRDLVIISAVANKLDTKAAEIMRAILRLCETTTDPSDRLTCPVSFTEILQSLPKDFGMTRSTAEQYLRVMTDDMPEFITKTAESSGGMYIVNLFQAYEALCKAHIESVVQERFGSKSLRIFRVVLVKKQVEQPQIESCAMIPAKETKELLYRMMQENFVTFTELAKTPDHAPSRTFYLFNVNLRQVAAMMLERCYKAVSNAMLKRSQEMSEHKRLLDKQERVDAIIATLGGGQADEAQKEEIREMITPPERQQLNRVKTVTNMLELSELQVDETIFVLETYLSFIRRPPVSKKV